LGSLGALQNAQHPVAALPNPVIEWRGDAHPGGHFLKRKRMSGTFLRSALTAQDVPRYPIRTCGILAADRCKRVPNTSRIARL
jgi:hypothetical protein